MVKRFRALAALSAVSSAALAASPAAAQQCDRQCLIELTDDYLSALATNDAGSLPIADDVEFVENLQKMEVGEGLWQSASGGPTEFSIPVPDQRNQTIGWIGMMEQDGEPALVSIRLKLEDGEIAEAEHLITNVRPENMVRLQTPRPGLLAPVPEGSRMDHDELIRMGASYYDALDDNDGTLMPFADDCVRHENGMITAGASAGGGPNNAGAAPRDCEGQLTSNVMAYIDDIENRRVFAADPVTGLVIGFSHFRHAMDFEPYEVTALDGSTILYDTDRLGFEPFDLPAAHIFKIGADGQVHEIEAMGFMTAYNSPTGWE